MATNLFLRFAYQGATNNLLTDPQYQVDSMRYTGNQLGVARRALVNKVLKQGASMAYAIGEAVVFAADIDIADDGDGLDNLIEYLKRAFLPAYIEADANKFLRVNAAGDGLVFTPIEYATQTVPGLICIATKQEVDAATDYTKSVTPATLAKGLANGVAPLGPNSIIPSQYLPSVADGVPGLVSPASITEVNAATINNKYVSPLTLLKNRADGVAPLDSSVKVPLTNLHFNEANAIAPLDGNKLVPQANLPQANTSTPGVIAIATEPEVTAGTVSNKAVTPYLLLKGKANGLCPLGSDTKFSLDYHPNSGVTFGSYSRVTVNPTGHVTYGDNNLNAAWLTSGIFPIARHPLSGAAAGTFTRVSVDAYGHVTAGSYTSTNKNISIGAFTIPLWSSSVNIVNVALGVADRAPTGGLTIRWTYTYYNGEVNTTFYFYIRQTASGGNTITLGSRGFSRQWNGYTGTYTSTYNFTPSWSGECYFYVRAAASYWDSTGGNSHGNTSTATVTFLY